MYAAFSGACFEVNKKVVIDGVHDAVISATGDRALAARPVRIQTSHNSARFDSVLELREVVPVRASSTR